MACVVAASAQSWRDNRAKLCFVRYEDNGAINILESWVRVEEYRVPLIGGQAACVFVDRGDVKVVATSTVPYEPDSTDEEACKSPVLNLHVVANGSRVFFIDPAVMGGSYSCGWQIREAPLGREKRQKAKHR